MEKSIKLINNSMLQHLINKDDAYDNNKYSVYLNPDKELKKKIVEYVKNIDTKTLDLGWPAQKWTIESKDGNEYKCISGRDVKYFTSDVINDGIVEHIKLSVNTSFITSDYFKSCFGILYYYNETQFKILNITESIDFSKIEGSLLYGREYNNLDSNYYQTEIKYNIDTYDRIELSIRPSITMMFLSFNNDGDFVNRNYNDNLNLYTNVEISVNDIYFSLINILKSKVIGNITKKGDYFYTDSYIFIPYMIYEKYEYKFGFETIKKRNNNYQNRAGYKIYKKPAKGLVDVTFNDMVTHLNNMLTDDVKKFLTDEFIQNYNVDFVNRK